MLIKDIDAWIGTEEGNRTLCALKACRDAVNLRGSRKGQFLVIGIGSSPKMANLTCDSAQAFFGAMLMGLPMQFNNSVVIQ
ncbi:hypothetical protein GJ699_00195 [Duganella sp. FT80W]|uniref:Uncharacterized protein n=1 Tax=Duganella guangzhouensis TaxID=2666084 RepID=A0A6I2KS38_9BURK|nr:hypothetical protein [Duganella guangzhouensis]MRW88403.1 hypothetical protein [Duganella guangzhouensis]